MRTQVRSVRDESPSCVGDEGSELAVDGDLLLAVQGARVRKNLQPHVGAVSLYVRARPVQEVVDDCRGVPTEYRYPEPVRSSSMWRPSHAPGLCYPRQSRFLRIRRSWAWSPSPVRS
jgi:hypothetical protein